MSIRIRCGVNVHESEALAGKTVGWVRSTYKDALNMDGTVEPRINNVKVAEDYVLRMGDDLEFVKPWGQKGLDDWHHDPRPVQPFGKVVPGAENALRVLEKTIDRYQNALVVSRGSTSGSGSPEDRALEIGDVMRRCAELPKEATAIVESAWGELDKGGLADWDAAGRSVLEILDKQEAVMARAANLLRHDGRNGLPQHAAEELNVSRSLLLERAREFRDSWPWSTGNKPDDEEDVAGARKALEALPSFDVLWRLARDYPPPPGSLDEE
jgi:hypothetical protein